MTIAIRLQEAGPPSVLHIVDVECTRPGPGEVWLEQEAIGVNYLDITQRNGAVKIPMPNGIGLEAAGRVGEVGPDVTHVKVGDRVVYALGPLGAYASGRIYPADRLVRLPDAISSEDAAAIFFKGLTAQYLLKSTYPVQAGTVVLAYGAAGGVGQILAAWARHLGATVIGVVSKEASVERARAAGCSEVLIWGKNDLPAEVARLTDGRKADVVYDGIGKLTFDTSLDCLRIRGTMVSIGASSGTPDPVSVATLNGRGSLFLTRPGLAHHITEIAEYRQRARDILDAVEQGIIDPSSGQLFPLVEVIKAHEALEDGTARGAVVLTV
ncbi:quinone oxidoreductase family protein [Paracoccus rhizosphaerae]|uniref:Quinone oxidoreductase n=1 Tax=Paracoccus rhizosphaerae TaxID=1133347 RepID=A0ABV6CHY6_9RHOB|nr:quinone oxidoreductase [Paracoccus rhizosphaerae]